MDIFNYVAGLVPVLQAHIKDLKTVRAVIVKYLICLFIRILVVTVEWHWNTCTVRAHTCVCEYNLSALSMSFSFRYREILSRRKLDRVLNVLKEFEMWLNARDAKNRQKLLRNLKVNVLNS